MKRPALLMAFAAALICGATAQAEELGTIRVESTTIDDRFENKRNEPSSTVSLSGEEVDKSHIENLQQVLQGIPGITTEVQSGDSIKIHIRGVENQRYMGEKPGVAVVIDGVPVFERTGRVNIDLDNIESVKVLKGGASYLFGEDALSGAVIITTKRGAKLKGVKVDAESGSFGYRKELMRIGAAGEKFNTFVQASERKSDSYYFQGGYKADSLTGKLQYYLTDSSDLTLGIENTKRNKDSHGTVTGVTQAMNDPQSLNGRDYARKFEVGLYKYYATYAADTANNGNLLLNLYQFGDDTNFLSAPQNFSSTGASVSDVDAYTTGNEYRQVQRGFKGEWRSGGERVAYMAAVDLRRNGYKNFSKYLLDFKTSPNSPRVYRAGTVVSDNLTNESVYAAYGEMKFKATPALTLTANARFDQIAFNYVDSLYAFSKDKTFNVDSWRFGANYGISSQWDAFANLSTGFRTPTVDQLYAGDMSPTGTTASNPDLRPEKSLNYELGTRATADISSVPVTVEASVFQIDRSDFIISSSGQYSVPASGSTDQFQNIGGVQNRGLEFSLSSDRSLPYSFDLSYTYLQAKFTKYDNFNLILGNRYGNPTIVHYDLAGKQVPRTPDQHLNFTVRAVPAAGVTLSGELEAVSSYYADELNWMKVAGYGVMNLMASYDTRWKFGTVSFFVRLDNALDRKYYATVRTSGDANYDRVFNEEDLSITVNPGRVWTAGISAAF